MPSNTADFRSDLGDIKAKLDSALVGVRIAEKMALDATAVLDRIQTQLRTHSLDARPQSPPLAQTPADAETLNVRPKRAAQLLGCSLDTVWKMIDDGRLKSFKRGKARLITMSSVRAAAEGEAPA